MNEKEEKVESKTEKVHFLPLLSEFFLNNFNLYLLKLQQKNEKMRESYRLLLVVKLLLKLKKKQKKNKGNLSLPRPQRSYLPDDLGPLLCLFSLNFLNLLIPLWGFQGKTPSPCLLQELWREARRRWRWGMGKCFEEEEEVTVNEFFLFVCLFWRVGLG